MPQPEIEDIQKSIGYKFKNPDILFEALTHKSFKHENPGLASSHNERLEFIGDSVLGLVVSDYLYKCDVGFTEAEMSRAKSHLVKGKVLAELASGIELGSSLMVGKGEESSGGRKKASILANAMEAVFGAVFEDGGYSSARKTILKLFKERLDEAIASGDFADYKSELQELSQTRFGSLPEYRLVAQEGMEHKKVFTFEVFIGDRLLGRGRGHTKKEAQSKAANQALKTFQNFA